MGSVGPGRPYNTYYLSELALRELCIIHSTQMLPFCGQVEHRGTMYTPGQEGGRETETYGLDEGGGGCRLKSIQTST